MATIPHTRTCIQWLLGPLANELAVTTHFTQRESKLTGSAFVQALVFSGLAEPAWTYAQLCQGALNAGVVISPQGLEQRFTAQAVDLLAQLLQTAVSQSVTSQPTAIPILQRFAGVVIRDSSVIGLPASLQEIWPGVGNSHGSTAALKLQVKLDYATGQIGGPILHAGRVHDQRSPFHSEDLPARTLRLGDLGYFELAQFARDHRRQVYWISRYKGGTTLSTESGQSLDLLAWLRGLTTTQAERSIQLGAQGRIPARLWVQRVPQEVADQRRRKLNQTARKKQQAVSAEVWALAEWTVILTNLPADRLSLREALVLLRVRWQIECLFRVWKGQFQIDAWRSTKPWRILCEVYAKLIGVVLFQWCVQIHLWALPDHSLWKAATVLHQMATSLALTLQDGAAFERVLEHIQTSFMQICHLTRRRGAPNTCQRLLAAGGEP